MAKQATTEPMHFPEGKSVPTKTLKVWLALAPNPAHERAVRRILKDKARTR